MAKHRIRRWFQFGILDVLLLTTVAAIVAVLYRPVQAKMSQAAPWVVGMWESEPAAPDPFALWLLPDGCYCRVATATPERNEWGFPWKITRFGDVQSAFALECGTLPLIIESEWGSGIIRVLNEDGSIHSMLEEAVHIEGPLCAGVPEGDWKITGVNQVKGFAGVLKYRNGQPVDLHANGERALGMLNGLREARGLSALTERDFDYDAIREKSP